VDIPVEIYGAFGASLQEILFWYGKRQKLTSQKYQSMLRSLPYWVSVAVFIISAGIITGIWLSGNGAASSRIAIWIGYTFPLILKQAGGTITRSGGRKLGVSREATFSFWKDYFD